MLKILLFANVFCAFVYSFFRSTSLWLLAAIIFLPIIFVNWPVNAQKSSGVSRASKVGVAVVRSIVISDYSDVQGRMVAGPIEAITAPTNALTEISELRIGDIIKPGDVVAVQSEGKLKLTLSQLRAKMREIKLHLGDLDSEMIFDGRLLALSKEQSQLLDAKAERARGLVKNNALPSSAADTALNASLSAKMKVIDRESSIARKKSQSNVNKVITRGLQEAIDLTDLDIAALEIKAKTAGQITFLAEFRYGYAREGETLAKVLNLDQFEIEAEIPVSHLNFVENAEKVFGRGLDGSLVEAFPRVVLPRQNLRTATRTMRFDIKGITPNSLQAENAIVVLQIPVSGPEPQLVVPKDAILPIAGGHMVYLAVEGRAKRQIIQLGSAVKNAFIVKNGLIEGQTVIVRGNESLSDGKKINFKVKSKNSKKLTDTNKLKKDTN
ncbi:hypothetical protein N8500_08730 [Candidatus Puniceispirillum sp.]|nr:hypothetical protein [Candidatus Puniceispirillum sp.]